MKGRERASNLSEDDSDLLSDDSVNIVMELDDAAIDIDEFHIMDHRKFLKKMPDTNSQYSRKRSYSKEDVKIGLNNIGDTGALSPEFILSDEDQYEANEEYVIGDDFTKFKENSKGNPIYRKCHTGPGINSDFQAFLRGDKC